MKKLMLLAALLAMLMVIALPAVAQVDEAAEQEADSGDLEQTVEPSLSGDNSTQCVGDLLQGNTGNAQDQNQAIQYASGGSASPSGDASIELNPEFEENMVTCDATLNQAAAAG